MRAHTTGAELDLPSQATQVDRREGWFERLWQARAPAHAHIIDHKAVGIKKMQK